MSTAVSTANGTLHIPSLASNLPRDWQWRRLDDACEGIFDCPHSTPVLTTDGPFVVRTQDVMTGTFRADQAAHVSEETYQERIRRAEPQHGDLLYSREGTYFGVAAEVPSNTRVCLGQRMVLLRPKAKEVYARYLKYWLNSPILAAHVHGHRDGTVAERLNMPTIRALPIPIPPIGMQRRIGDILGSLDDKIELNRRMNDTLESMARRHFKSWFIDFDPVHAKARLRHEHPTWPNDRLSREALPKLAAKIAELFPDEFEETTLGRIPKGWRVTPVADTCTSITSGSTPARMNPDFWTGGDIPWFKTGELFDGPLLGSEEHITQAGLVNSSCKLWGEGTILFALYASPTVGRMGILTRPGTSNQAAAGLVPHSDIGVPFLLNALFFAREKLQQIAVGAAQQNINQRVLKNHPLVMPEPALSRHFSEIWRDCLTLQESLANESVALTSSRDRLLPQLLSGRLLDISDLN